MYGSSGRNRLTARLSALSFLSIVLAVGLLSCSGDPVMVEELHTAPEEETQNPGEEETQDPDLPDPPDASRVIALEGELERSHQAVMTALALADELLIALNTARQARDAAYAAQNEAYSNYLDATGPLERARLWALYQAARVVYETRRVSYEAAVTVHAEAMEALGAVRAVYEDVQGQVRNARAQLRDDMYASLEGISRIGAERGLDAATQSFASRSVALSQAAAVALPPADKVALLREAERQASRHADFIDEVVERLLTVEPIWTDRSAEEPFSETELAQIEDALWGDGLLRSPFDQAPDGAAASTRTGAADLSWSVGLSGDAAAILGGSLGLTQSVGQGARCVYFGSSVGVGAQVGTSGNVDLAFFRTHAADLAGRELSVVLSGAFKLGFGVSFMFKPTIGALGLEGIVISPAAGAEIDGSFEFGADWLLGCGPMQ